MRNGTISAVALTMLSASFLFGQAAGTPPTPPTDEQIVARRVARLTTLLSLTAAQQTQATTIFTTEQTAVAALRTGLQTSHTALQAAIKSNDLTGITTQATQIG